MQERDKIKEQNRVIKNINKKKEILQKVAEEKKAKKAAMFAAARKLPLVFSVTAVLEVTQFFAFVVLALVKD